MLETEASLRSTLASVQRFLFSSNINSFKLCTLLFIMSRFFCIKRKNVFAELSSGPVGDSLKQIESLRIRLGRYDESLKVLQVSDITMIEYLL
jgi:hypothetical protein